MTKRFVFALISVSILAHPTLLLAQSQTADAAKEAFLKSEKAAYLNQIQATLVLDKPQALQEDPGGAAGDQEEDVESSPGAPILQTEDTGTPGPGGIEINLLTNCDRSSVSRACENVIDANYGIGEKMQISVQRGYNVEHTEDGEVRKGMSPTEFGVKYRFYEKKGFSMAVAPTVTIDNSKMHSSDPLAQDDREGNAIYLPVIVSKEIGKYTVVTNAGYRRMSKGREYDSIIAAAAVGREINEKSRVMGEVYSERDRNLVNRRTDVRVGYIRIISPKDSKFTVSGFASIGRSIGKTEDGKPHTSVNLGLNIVRKQRQ